jgi:hypothetical protein
MLAWWEEGSAALIPDPKEPVWVKTPLSAPDKSLQKRSARLRLQEDGTMEGDVEIELTGHFAMELKEYYDDMSPIEQTDDVIESVKSRLSTADVSNVTLGNVKDPVKPLAIRYHVKVSQYAQRTGRRLFFQPGFFKQNEEQAFQAARRRYAVYFHYPWSEEDNITIELPQGFELENAEAPGAVKAGDNADQSIRMSLEDGRTLRYARSFSFGTNRTILFPSAEYDRVKLIFDSFHQRDTAALTLRETNAPAK